MMKHLRTAIEYIVMAALVFTVLLSVAVFADKHHDNHEGAELCTVNHLDEQCWEADGSFMKYNKEGCRSVVGVDVSKWNGDIDWKILKEQGVEFAIIRVGCRGYETGEIMDDDRFTEYMDGARDAGLDVGVYFYSQAIDDEEALEEAAYVMDKIAGYEIELPVFFDTEDVIGGDARTNIMAVANYTINALAFCEAIEEQGYKAGVYASKDWFKNNLDLASLSKYEIWYANYGERPGLEVGFDIWQYSKDGELDGCDTKLDMNVMVLKDN